MAKENGPIKIFEIKGQDWMKALSRVSTFMLGGIFKQATAYDPFESPGYCLPSLTPTAVSGASNSVSQLTPLGNGYMFGHGNTKLYKVDTNASTQTDETANIDTSGAFSAAGVWRNRYIYMEDTQARSVTFTPSGDVQVLASLTSGVPHTFATGADGNGYICNGAAIARLVLETGTTGNSTSVFSLEAGQISRDLVNDGRYLVIISDNNSSGNTTTKSKCLVSFWDMAKGTADIIYTIDDTFLIGAKMVNNAVEIIGRDNIYVCSAGSPPQVKYSFQDNASITERPTSASMLAVRRGVLLWASSSGGNVHALGNPFSPNKPVLFTPYSSTSGNNQALAVTGNKIWTSTSLPAIYNLVGSTRTSATLITAPITFPQAYRLDYVKVVTQGPLVSGDSLNVAMTTRNSNGNLLTGGSRTFSTDPGKTTFIFYKDSTGGTNDVFNFEDISTITMTVGKQPWAKLEVWATPVTNQYQE